MWRPHIRHSEIPGGRPVPPALGPCTLERFIFHTRASRVRRRGPHYPAPEDTHAMNARAPPCANNPARAHTVAMQTTPCPQAATRRTHRAAAQIQAWRYQAWVQHHAHATPQQRPTSRGNATPRTRQAPGQAPGQGPGLRRQEATQINTSPAGQPTSGPCLADPTQYHKFLKNKQKQRF